MTAVMKDCHCILPKSNSQLHCGEMGYVPIPHMVTSAVYLHFMHLPQYGGHNFAPLVTCSKKKSLPYLSSGT